MQRRVLPAGSYLARQGQVGSECVLLESGLVELSQRRGEAATLQQNGMPEGDGAEQSAADPASRHVLASVSGGSCFGESCLFHGAPWEVDAVTMSPDCDSVVWTLQAADVKSLCMHYRAYKRQRLLHWLHKVLQLAASHCPDSVQKRTAAAGVHDFAFLRLCYALWFCPGTSVAPSVRCTDPESS